MQLFLMAIAGPTPLSRDCAGTHLTKRRMALAFGILHAALLLVGAAVLVQHATAQSGTTAFGSFLTECGETKDPNTVVPNPLSCQVVHDIQAGDRHTYTVQVRRPACA
jgi:hypothetical protein